MEYEEIVVKIRQDRNYFYILLGDSMDWEKIRKDSLPHSIRTLLKAYMSPRYNVLVQADIDESEGL